LARGDRRDFVAVDPQGGTHSLSRRIDGATAKDVRERLADLDPRSLPSVAEAKEAQRQEAAREQPMAAATERAEQDARAPEPSFAPAAFTGEEESRVRTPRRVASTAWQAAWRVGHPVGGSTHWPGACRQREDGDPKQEVKAS
jgi:uncharacterized protein (DUF1800 family)